MSTYFFWSNGLLLTLKTGPTCRWLRVYTTETVAVSPIKALCNEKLIDWHKKFSDFGVNCITATSDSDDADLKSLEHHDLILSTPEKWDVLTRRWRSDTTLVSSVGLFLIDEVHLLNAGSRGSTLEVIVRIINFALFYNCYKIFTGKQNEDGSRISKTELRK